MVCPNPKCQKVIITLGTSAKVSQNVHTQEIYLHEPEKRIVRPAATSRPVPKEVTGSHRADFEEATLIISLSPKASAALSRRSLQNILREKAGVAKSDLSKEIDEILASGKLPTQLAESIDAVRNVGNFAAHPIKSMHTGEIVEVEVGEAEWLLDVLEGLFDFYFVQPEILKRKREELNEKLKAAGKPPLK